jgi:hypothetical protein
MSRSIHAARTLVYLGCQRPSLCNSQVGSCNYCFGACSAFTHLMAAHAPSRLATLYTESSDSFVAPPSLRLLPGGAIQFPGGSCTR